jgi:hypothetical protein
MSAARQRSKFNLAARVPMGIGHFARVLVDVPRVQQRPRFPRSANGAEPRP